MFRRSTLTIAISSLFLVVLLLIAAAIYFSSSSKEENNIIEDTFDAIQKETASLSFNETVASVQDINVTYERFLFYKYNIEMFHALSNTEFSASDEELLNELLKKDLTIREAKNEGIAVAKEEVEQEIKFQQQVLENPEYTADNKELIQKIMKKRIEITGLTNEQFWESDMVYKQYEDALYLGKFYTYLLNKGEIQTMEQFTKYQDQLLESREVTICIE